MQTIWNVIRAIVYGLNFFISQWAVTHCVSYIERVVDTLVPIGAIFPQSLSRWSMIYLMNRQKRPETEFTLIFCHLFHVDEVKLFVASYHNLWLWKWVSTGVTLKFSHIRILNQLQFHWKEKKKTKIKLFWCQFTSCAFIAQ